MPEASATLRTGKRLHDATRPFTEESPVRSWWSVISTLGLLGFTLLVAARAQAWPARLAASVLGGLLMVRVFILYHDFMHGALLRRSRVARAGFYLIGLILLAPPRYWRYSHNFHHAHVGKPMPPETGSVPRVTWDIGSFPLMSTAMWRAASRWQRLRYRAIRHPLTLLGAYVTVFLFGLCVMPWLQNPRKYWDGPLALLAHGGVLAGIWWFAGFSVVWYAFMLPFAIAAAAGAYLFFAQHNYQGMLICRPEEWTYYRGATESSSHMKLGRIMHWFTGNIGFHHIHHLNPLIPFYRLPEAMAAIPELQEANTTSLRLRDISACLRLNLWDPENHCLVGYGQARA